MKKVRKVLLVVLSVLTLAAVSLCATSCDVIKEYLPVTQTKEDDVSHQVYDKYLVYAEEQDIIPLSYAEWLQSIRGEQGPQGEKGEDGFTPYIGENGNWWIGDVDTGICASGEKGEQGVGVASVTIDEDGCLIVTLTDGTVNNLGCVKHECESIALKEISITEEKKLAITLSTGLVIETSPLDVSFEGLINGIGINSKGELLIYTSIGVTNNYGKIVHAYVTTEGEFMLEFEDGNNLSLGYITGDSEVQCEHTYGEYEVIYPATCITRGYGKSVCSQCGNTLYTVYEALGHSYDKGIVIKEDNGSEPGCMLYTCKICSTVKMEQIGGYSEGLDYELIQEGTEYCVSGIGECVDTDIIIPDEHEGLPVTEIGEKAFYGCDIVSVYVPETVKEIKDKAFSECAKLENITMSDDIKIGVDVFRGSININIIIKHDLEFVEGKEATCAEPGNVPYYYCATCNFYYEDKDATKQIFDVVIPNSHEFVDGVCDKCGAIQSEVLIVSIDKITHLGKYPLGTLSNAIGLPERINVQTADSLTHTLNVVWDTSTYDKSQIGEYSIVGYIQSEGFFFADGLTNQVGAQVEIVDFIEGTADIVFVLDISGSMEEEIDNVKNNIIKFAQMLEERGVSARWSAITYSDSVAVPDDPNEETTIIQNGATPWFSSASEYKTAMSGISLAYGGDNPEMAVDGLMAANSLENRKDARVFYILLTDNTYKNDNNYSVSGMEEATRIISESGANVSVITSSSYYSAYQNLADTTGGIMSDIYGNFAQDLFDRLVPIIYDEVIA